MEIKKNIYKKVCDMGFCRNVADYCICFESEIDSSLDICEECLKKLSSCAKKVLNEKK